MIRRLGHRLHQWWTTRLSAAARQRLKLGLRLIFLAGILGYLAYQLTAIGWDEVLRSLPATPWFYVLFVLIYASLPLAETLIYGLVWKQPNPWRALPVFVKKRVFNKDVLGYSGEVYLYAWARRRLGMPDRAIAETIRDTNILSSAASTVVAVLLLGLFLTAGRISLGDLTRGVIGEAEWPYLVGGGLAVAILLVVAVQFRRYLFGMAARMAGLVFAIYVGRLVLGQVLQITQWAVVLPSVGLEVWFTFAAVSLIITRLPFVPNQDLLFLGAGLELSGALAVPRAELAAMLLTASVLDKAMNALLFGAITLHDRQRSVAAEPPSVHSESTPTPS